MTNDKIDNYSKLTEFDYAYLKGDKVMYPSWGAALAVVSDWCRNMGYGHFGEPTPAGEKAMKEYENNVGTDVGSS